MATKKNSSAKSPQATSRSNRDSMRWILGLLLLFAGLFLTASVLFYYFDWRADMSLVSGVEQEDPRLADLSDAIENPCGYAGAWLAERLVGRSFGLFGIILPLIVTMVGVRIIRQRPLLFNHSVLGALLILILGSLTLGFAFGEKWAVFGSGWGGAFGVEVARRLTSVIGVLGNIILLLGAWILTGVFINRNFINTVNTAGNAMVDKGGKIVDLVKQSVVNVADHRSKSGEEKTDPEPEPDSKPESERPQPEPVPAPVDASARTSAADGAAEVTILLKNKTDLLSPEGRQLLVRKSCDFVRRLRLPFPMSRTRVPSSKFPLRKRFLQRLPSRLRPVLPDPVSWGATMYLPRSIFREAKPTLPLPHPGNPSNRSMRRSPRRSWTELRNIRLRRSRKFRPKASW